MVGYKLLPDRPVVVVMPTHYGAPRVPSTRVECQRCKQACWLSKRATPDPVTVCVVCAMAVVRPGDVITVAPWVAADLADAPPHDPLADL